MLFITEEKYKLAKQLKECIGELQQVGVMLVGGAVPILYRYWSIFGGIGKFAHRGMLTCINTCGYI